MGRKMSATRRRTIERDAETAVLKSERDVQAAAARLALDETLATIKLGNEAAKYRRRGR
jgi:hypothetical protein